MASRPIFAPALVIPATTNNMTGTAVITSAVSIIQNVSFISYNVSWTGTPTGAFSVEISNDYAVNAAGGVANAGTWVSVPLTGSPVASGTSGTGFIDIVGTAAYAIRLKYANASGTGTLHATVNGKVA